MPNPPINETLVREVVCALNGSLYHPSIDANGLPLAALTGTDGIKNRMGPFLPKIYGVTEGPGQHVARWGTDGPELGTYTVPENAVFATIDDMHSLAGMIATYRLERIDKNLKFNGAVVKVHAMS